MRKAEIERKTRETQIELSLDLDGTGKNEIDTGVGFFNHMLELLSVHSGADLFVRCKGDTDVDYHHSVEDVGICLGKAIAEALGERRGIARFADRVLPMDECAAQVAIDLGGRAYLNFEDKLSGKIGTFDGELAEEFFQRFEDLFLDVFSTVLGRDMSIPANRVRMEFAMGGLIGLLHYSASPDTIISREDIQSFLRDMSRRG